MSKEADKIRAAMRRLDTAYVDNGNYDSPIYINQDAYDALMREKGHRGKQFRAYGTFRGREVLVHEN